MNLRMIVVALVVLGGRAWGQEVVPPPPLRGSELPQDRPLAPPQDRPLVGRDELASALAPRPDASPGPAALAGLPENAPVVDLTLAKVVALAVGKAEDPEETEPLTDAKVLDALIARGESLPIDRAKDRLGAPGAAGGLALARPYFEALRAYSLADVSSRTATRYKIASELFHELAKSETSGISQLQLDQIQLQFLQQQGGFFENRSRYRDALDGLKQALKLPPEAPIVIDPAALAGFQAFTLARTAWQADPNHDVNGLDVLVRTLPKLPEARIGETVVEDQDDEAGLSTVRKAIEAEGKLEMVFQVRAVIRSMARFRNQYELDRLKFLLSGRQFDSTLQQLSAPPQANRVPARGMAVMVLNVILSETGLARADEQLTQDWCQYQEQRLMLQTSLGQFPYNSWEDLQAAYTATAPE